MDSYIYGYARVSTRQQELDRQLDLLKNYKAIVPPKNLLQISSQRITS